jgi:hypothetical protein
MIDNAAAGETVFNEFYTEQEQQEDPTKRNTGLFFYRGKRGAPFAIICPGGGFEYVGTLHEGLPLASRISKKELNALTTLLPSRATRLDVYSRAPAYPTLRVKITTHTAEEKMTGWRELSVGVVATLLTLVALPRASTGQVPLVGPRAEIITEPDDRSGPRLGVAYLTRGSETAKQLNKPFYPVTTLFGWQFEHPFDMGPEFPTVVSELVLLVGGLEQNVVLPSATWLIGVRQPNGFEFGVGPTITGGGTQVTVATGVTHRFSLVNVPINVAVAPARKGVSLSLTAGFNWQRS